MHIYSQIYGRYICSQIYGPIRCAYTYMDAPYTTVYLVTTLPKIQCMQVYILFMVNPRHELLDV